MNSNGHKELEIKRRNEVELGVRLDKRLRNHRTFGLIDCILPFCHIAWYGIDVHESEAYLLWIFRDGPALSFW